MMVSVTVTPQPVGEPPRSQIQLDASPGCVFESCELTRVQDGVELPVRRQPQLGVSNPVCYDYESRYGVPAQYHIAGIEKQTLTTAWTGTADASTSTLSQDGNLVATNQIYSSNAHTPMQYLQLNNSDVWVAAPAPIADGSHYRYTVSDNIKAAAINLSWSNIPAGQILVVRTDANADKVGVEYATIISSTPTMSVWKSLAGVNHSIYLCGMYGARLNAGESLTLTGLGEFTQSDWAAMQAVDVDWFSGSTYQAGTTSQYDVTGTPVTLTPDSGWLIHPANPAKSMRLPLGRLTTIGDTTRRMNATRHDILGARNPIYTIPGPRHSKEYELQVRTRTLDEESMLDALLDDQTPILLNLLNTDCTRLNLQPMYLQVGDTVDSRYAQTLYPADGSTPDLMRDWKLPCIQVGSPAIGQQASGWTYAQLLNDYSTYRQAYDAYATYADLIENNKES